jgi:hypothetical protein
LQHKHETLSLTLYLDLQEDSKDSDLSEYSEDNSEEMSDEDLSSEGMDSDEAEVYETVLSIIKKLSVVMGSHQILLLRSGGRKRRTREAVRSCWKRAGPQSSRRKRNLGIGIGPLTTLTMTAHERKAVTLQVALVTARLAPNHLFPLELREVTREVVRSAARRVRGASPDPAGVLMRFSVCMPCCIFVG